MLPQATQSIHRSTTAAAGGIIRRTTETAARMRHDRPQRLPSYALASALLVGASSLAGCFFPTLGFPYLPQPLVSASTASHPAGRRVFDGYPTGEQLRARLVRIAASQPSLARLDVIGRTAGGRDLLALSLAAPAPVPPASRPAVLLVAGLNAMHRCGPAVAVQVAEQLAGAARDPHGAAARMLTDHTVYVLPMMNPDRLALLSADDARSSTRPAEPVGVNLRPVDDDRDDRIDEDPAEDLNHDGVITQMRVRGKNPTHAVDADDPRLLKRADPLKAEKAEYEVYSEGLDNDDDGQYNEDGSGGVNLAANFPHLYRPNEPDSGPNAVSELETRALADFVIAHQNISAVIVFGPHDNLVRTPSVGKPDATGQSFRELHPDDAAIWGEIAKVFRDLTGLKDARSEDVEGSFHAWCYAQRGLPAFATTLWQPPEDIPASKPASMPATAPVAASLPATASAPQVGAAVAAATQPSSQPSTSPLKPDVPAAVGKKDEPPPELVEDRRWLRYSDVMRDHAGFIDWRPFQHPTLGAVEIGGFVPGFKLNPPAAALETIAEKQLAFLLDIAGRLPQVNVERAVVSAPGAGLYAIELWVVNSGYLPTALAMSRKAGQAHAIIIRPQLPPERIVGGQRVERIEWLGGSGGRDRRRWLVLGAAGERVRFRLYFAPVGEFEYAVDLPAR